MFRRSVTGDSYKMSLTSPRPRWHEDIFPSNSPHFVRQSIARPATPSPASAEPRYPNSPVPSGMTLRNACRNDASPDILRSCCFRNTVNDHPHTPSKITASVRAAKDIHPTTTRNTLLTLSIRRNVFDRDDSFDGVDYGRMFPSTGGVAMLEPIQNILTSEISAAGNLSANASVDQSPSARNEEANEQVRHVLMLFFRCLLLFEYPEYSRQHIFTTLQYMEAERQARRACCAVCSMFVFVWMLTSAHLCGLIILMS